MAQNKKTDGLLTPKQVAEKLGVHEKTIKLWIAEGRIKAIRLGHRIVRVEPSELDRFLREAPSAATQKKKR